VFLVTPTRRRVVALLATLLIAVVTATPALPVAAQTVASCSDQFAVLRADTATVQITGGKVEKERDGLQKLVDDAQALASIGKTDDASTKLGDFTVKVNQLEAAGRISAESATLLRADANAASACLQGTP
jgi:hypothetical protein